MSARNGFKRELQTSSSSSDDDDDDRSAEGTKRSSRQELSSFRNRHIRDHYSFGYNDVVETTSSSRGRPRRQRRRLDEDNLEDGEDHLSQLTDSRSMIVNVDSVIDDSSQQIHNQLNQQQQMLK